MNMTQAAKQLGVSEATISRICAGERRPSLDLMLTIRTKWRWSIERQANAIRGETYPAEFKERMESRRVRT